MHGGSGGGHHGLDISGASAGHGAHNKTIGSPTTAPSLNDKYGAGQLDPTTGVFTPST